MTGCPGYVQPPFDVLTAECPGTEVFPARDFRVEWGPIFHRGRLDGSAKVLVLGQDPAAHEAITRRILVGAAGQRVQGLLTRLGLTRGYVMVNAFVYSVFGQGGGERHRDDLAIAAYRNRWLDALLLGSKVTAVITFGGLAADAYARWASGQPRRSGRIWHAELIHPTYPESAAAASGRDLAETTARLLENWNAALPDLDAHVRRDRDGSRGPVPPYGTTWAAGDLSPIPADDLPVGVPTWWGAVEPWAARTGSDAQTRRATITVTIPPRARSWPPL